MKNYKVMATRFFKDSNEIDEKTGLKVERQVNDVFYCTKERYEFLKLNNAVKLVDVQETFEEVVNEIVEEQEELENDSTYEEDLAIDEEVEEKTKKKKSSKK